MADEPGMTHTRGKTEDQPALNKMTDEDLKTLPSRPKKSDTLISPYY